MAYTTATLTGTYLTGDGQPASGVIEIIPNYRALIDAEGDVILSGRIKVTLDETGSFSATLPSTDDETVEPATGRQYTVSAKLRHQHLPAVTGIELAAGETVDMADVTSAVETTAALSVWLTEEEYEAALAAKADAADLAAKANTADVTALDTRVDALEAAPGGVSSVNGEAGDVTLTAADVGADPAGAAAAVAASVPSEAELSATYGRRIASAEGIQWYAYGHSYLAQDSRNTPGARYIDRLKGAHYPAAVNNRATGGRLAQQVARDAIGNQTPKWVTGSKGLVVVDLLANDMIWRGAHSTGLAALPLIIRALCATLSAGSRIEDTDAAWTYTGTWSSLTGNNLLSGGTAKNSAGTASNEAASIQFTGTGATLLTVGWDSTSGRDQGELLIDGTVVQTVETGGLFLADGANNYMPHVARVTGLANTTHTLTWRRKNTRAGNIWVDALLTHTDAAPTVVLVKQAYMSSAAYTINGIATPGNDATVDAYNAILDTVAAEFDNVFTADPSDGWDKATMMGADGYHPNDRGMAHYAAAIEATLAGVGWRHGQNKLTD